MIYDTTNIFLVDKWKAIKPMVCPICNLKSNEWKALYMIGRYLCTHKINDNIYIYEFDIDTNTYSTSVCNSREFFQDEPDYILVQASGLISPERIEKFLVLK